MIRPRTVPGGLLRLARFALLAAALLVGAAAGRADSAGSKEYELKAAFLYNFTKFVVWPPNRLPGATSPIVIGIYGKNPFGDELAAALRERKVDGRPIVLREIEEPAQASGIHLLFIPGTEDRALEPVLQAVRASSVLTVGESDAFEEQGGIITFVVTGEKLRFAIDMNAAERAGLKISAQLQKLAHRVRRSP